MKNKANVQRSTLNVQRPISNKTRYFRWIGRSEGDGTAKAAKPLTLSACSAVV
jgi:hypothetical protein